MAKKGTKNIVLPDSRFMRVDVAKLINKIMERGKKNAARKIVYKAFDIIAEKTKKDSLEVFENAIKNATPLLEVKSKRVGGATYQVPVEVKKDRGMTLAMRWMISAAKSKKGKPMSEKLAEEIINSSNKEGSAVKKKEDTHRMAEANRAFAHFAW